MSRAIFARQDVRAAVLTSCLLVTVAACARDEEPALRSRAELSAAILRSATYRSQYVEDGEVALHGGVFRDTASRVGVFFQPEYATGDLDADGVPDAAVVLATTTGGSGTFHDLAVVLNREGQPIHSATLFMGDRVPVDRIRIVEQEIQVDLTMHGPADPMCCPSVRTTRRFRLQDGILREVTPGSEGADSKG